MKPDFVLGAVNGAPHPKMHCMMIEPGIYRVKLVQNGEFSAFRYTPVSSPPPHDTPFTTEFYSYHHAHNDPMQVVVNKYGGLRRRTMQLAFDAFVPTDWAPLFIDGRFPIPVMFCIADVDERGNEGGLSVVVEQVRARRDL
jgi:hypothetical protein